VNKSARSIFMKLPLYIRNYMPLLFVQVGSVDMEPWTVKHRLFVCDTNRDTGGSVIAAQRGFRLAERSDMAARNSEITKKNGCETDYCMVSTRWGYFLYSLF
jgi:hypothetical protein